MNLKEALKDLMPTGQDIKEQVTTEMGNAKSFFSNVLSDIGHEMKEQAKHGSHELAAALFNGDAFVMYPHENKPPDHGLPPQAAKEQEQQREQDGMELG